MNPIAELSLYLMMSLPVFVTGVTGYVIVKGARALIRWDDTRK